MGHSLDDYWKIFKDTKITGKYLRIQKFWSKRKCQSLRKLDQEDGKIQDSPSQGSLDLLVLPNRRVTLLREPKHSGTNDSMAIVYLLEAMGFITLMADPVFSVVRTEGMFTFYFSY